LIFWQITCTRKPDYISQKIAGDADENFDCNQGIKYSCQALLEDRRIEIELFTTLRVFSGRGEICQ
jgi:hypothetical protein